MEVLDERQSSVPSQGYLGREAENNTINLHSKTVEPSFLTDKPKESLIVIYARHPGPK